MSMIEKVARGLCAELQNYEAPRGAERTLEDLSAHERTCVFDLARAAIEAMREPTEGMNEAGYQAPPDYSDPVSSSDIPRIWNAMIQAALSEGEG